MLDVIINHWSVIVSVATLAMSGFVLLLSQTFAKHDDVSALRNRVSNSEKSINTINNAIDGITKSIAGMPTQKELHSLNLEISRLRGDMQATLAELKQVKHINSLLLDKELR